MDLYGPLKLFNAWNRDTDSLLRPWNGSEDNNMTNFSKILLKFAIVLKFLNIFCSFLSLAIINGQRSFSSLPYVLPEVTPETKIVLNFFTENSFPSNFSIFDNFLNISYLFDLFDNKVRKLKIAKSNQIKASLTKLWLATDEANHSRVPWEQLARRYSNMFSSSVLLVEDNLAKKSVSF